MPYAIAGWLDYEFQCIRKTIKTGTTRDATSADTGRVSASDAIHRKEEQDGLALCPVPDVNFFYQNPGEVEELLHDTHKHLLGCVELLGQENLPASPTSTSLPFYIGYQYAMDEDVLFNSILFHELGHHVAKMVGVQDKHGSRVADGLHKYLPRIKLYRKLRRDSPSAAEDMKLRYEEYVLNWIEELFCDAFGALIAGPQLAFALRDLSEPLIHEWAFTDSHPAWRFRLNFQWRVLKNAGWIKEQKINPRPTKRNQRASDKGGTSLSFIIEADDTLQALKPGEVPSYAGWYWVEEKMRVDRIIAFAIKMLDERLDDIEASARECVHDADERAASFWQDGPAVHGAFLDLLVPSTIALSSNRESLERKEESRRNAQPTRIIRPHPTTVINVARIIYEDGCRGLKERWPKGNQDNAPYRVQQHIERRLSAWTQKAVSDWFLYRGR